MITLDDKIVGIWFLGINQSLDWMAGLSEIEPDQKYKLTYRFRYHLDDKVFDSEDRKSWYEGTVSGTRNYCILALRSTAIGLKEHGGATGELYELINDTGDVRDFMKKWQDMPFVFMRQETLKKKKEEDTDGSTR